MKIITHGKVIIDGQAEPGRQVSAENFHINGEGGNMQEAQLAILQWAKDRIELAMSEIREQPTSASMLCPYIDVEGS